MQLIALAEAESEKAIREEIKGFINEALQKEKERREVEKDVFDTLTGERDLLEAKLNGTGAGVPDPEAD